MDRGEGPAAAGRDDDPVRDAPEALDDLVRDRLRSLGLGRISGSAGRDVVEPGRPNGPVEEVECVVDGAANPEDPRPVRGDGQQPALGRVLADEDDAADAGPGRVGGGRQSRAAGGGDEHGADPQRAGPRQSHAHRPILLGTRRIARLVLPPGLGADVEPGPDERGETLAERHRVHLGGHRQQVAVAPDRALAVVERDAAEVVAVVE